MASSMGLLRAQTPSQTKSTNRCQYLLQNKTKEEIVKECRPGTTRTTMEATELLKSHGMNINDSESDLYQIANTIMELTISRAGIPAHQADILQALSMII
jgi:phosphosulfolactate synthase (CoM biosynthesis protein A)